MRQHGNNTHGNNAHGNNVDMTRGKECPRKKKGRRYMDSAHAY